MISNRPSIFTTGLFRPVVLYFFFLCILLFMFFPTEVLFPEGGTTPATGTVQKVLREYRISQKDAERILSVCREAEQVKIPQELLIPRIREGMAKKIPISKLVDALHGDIYDLIQARNTILRIPNAEKFLQQYNLWQRTANLSAAGISSRVIGSLIEMSLTDPNAYQPTTGLYAALTGWGLSEIQGLRVVQSIVRSGLSVEEYPQVTSLFSRARQSLLSPDELIKRMESELPKVQSLRQLERRVLE